MQGSLALFGELGQVAAELVEDLGGAFAFGAAGRALRAAAAGAAERPHDLAADLLGVRVQVQQDARGDALFLAHEAEQDVLGADVVVTERERLAQRQLQDLFGARREGDLALRRLFAGADDAHDGRADLFDGHFEPVEHRAATPSSSRRRPSSRCSVPM